MSTPKFKVGDLVRCVKATCPTLVENQVYEVSHMDAPDFDGDVFVGVDGIMVGQWHSDRFVLKKPIRLLLPLLGELCSSK
jgi:hypothetical protein